MPRQSSKLTAEGKQTLQHQGVSPDCQDELAIVTARYGLDKRFKIVAVKSGKVSRDEVMEYIRYLLTTTKNDGGRIMVQTTLLVHLSMIVYYTIGAT